MTAPSSSSIKMAYCPISPTARRPSPLKNRSGGTDGGRGWRLDRAPNLAVLLALPLWLAGCASFNTKIGPPLVVHKEAFVVGETSVQTVLHDLGPPNQVSALSHGFVFLYEHSVIGE